LTIFAKTIFQVARFVLMILESCFAMATKRCCGTIEIAWLIQKSMSKRRAVNLTRALSCLRGDNDMSSYIAPDEIARLREVDLVTYLQTCNPDELVRASAREYKTKTHDSLRISNGKWYWHSRGIGGYSALDYLMALHNMSFIEAANIIKDRFGTAASIAVKTEPSPRCVVGKPRP
jgi:hypothetical protein